MAEQQQHVTYGAVQTAPSYDRTLFAPHDVNCLQQHLYADRQGFIPVHSQILPVTSLGYIDTRCVSIFDFLN
jgi:hypothetical protein